MLFFLLLLMFVVVVVCLFVLCLFVFFTNCVPKVMSKTFRQTEAAPFMKSVPKYIQARGGGGGGAFLSPRKY